MSKNLFENILISFLGVVGIVIFLGIIAFIIILIIVIDSWLYERSGGGYAGNWDKIHTSQWIFRGVCLFFVCWIWLFVWLMSK